MTLQVLKRDGSTVPFDLQTFKTEVVKLFESPWEVHPHRAADRCMFVVCRTVNGVREYMCDPSGHALRFATRSQANAAIRSA